MCSRMRLRNDSRLLLLLLLLSTVVAVVLLAGFVTTDVCGAAADDNVPLPLLLLQLIDESTTTPLWSAAVPSFRRFFTDGPDDPDEDAELVEVVVVAVEATAATAADDVLTDTVSPTTPATTVDDGVGCFRLACCCNCGAIAECAPTCTAEDTLAAMLAALVATAALTADSGKGLGCILLTLLDVAGLAPPATDEECELELVVVVWCDWCLEWLEDDDDNDVGRDADWVLGLGGGCCCW